MTMYRATGNQITKATAATLVTAVPVTDPLVRVIETLFEGVRPDGTTYPPGRRRIKFRAGQNIRQSELDACFPVPIIISIGPVTGVAAGNTFVTIKAANLTPGTTVTFGGTAATSITVVNEMALTCRTPAKAAGVVDVVVTNDAGSAMKTGGFTYTA